MTRIVLGAQTAERPPAHQLVTDVAPADGEFTHSSAVFDSSEARPYRYRLDRAWAGPYGGRAVFLMLNPSTADAFKPDPTVARCINFAKREGLAELTVVNLFAYRSTDPADLRRVFDPVGPMNDVVIHDAVFGTAATAEQFAGPPADLVVCAWGVHGTLLGRATRVLATLAAGGAKLHALKITGQGQPGHPLYLRNETPLQPFPPLPVVPRH